LNNDQIQSKCLLTECGKKLIPVSKRTILALTNIAFHKNRDQTHAVLYVSSCEHQRLKDLYDRLQNILRSKTFCGQFTNDGFPDYPFKGNCRATWVTPGQLDHLRIHPKGHLLFGWKRNSPKVYVFEQSKEGCTGDLLTVMKAPVSTHTSITDLIIDSENNIYLSIIFNKRNSLIFKAKLDEKLSKDCNLLLEWQTRAINNFKIVKLELSPWSRTNQLFAIALCKGMFLFNIAELFNNEIPINEVNWSFKASGHIAFDSKSDRVFATAYQGNDGTAEEQLSAVRSSINSSANTCDNGYYNSIVYFDGKNSKNRRITMAFPMVNDSLVVGNDGIVIAPSTNIQAFPSTPDISNPVDAALKIDARAGVVNARNYVLYIVGNEGNNKILYRFNANNIESITDNVVQWFGVRYHPFGENDQIALKYLRKGQLNGVIASRYNHNDLQYIPNDPQQYDTNLLSSIPVQAGPVELINDDLTGQLFVLNHSGESITVLNHELAKYDKQRVILKKYRDEVLNAYTQLLSSVLQYLKDCFCHKLLVECPECEEDDKVYLGCVTIKDNQVHNICNFSKRKYVKTFPTLSYWLSVIPVAPIVAWAVEELCCMILPNFNNQANSNFLNFNNEQLNLGRAALNIDHSNLLNKLAVDGQKLFKQGITSLIGSGQKDKISRQQLVSTQYTYRAGIVKPIKAKVVNFNNKELISQVGALRQTITQDQEQISFLKTHISTLKQKDVEIESNLNQVGLDKIQAELEIKTLKNEITQLSQQTQKITSLEGTINILQQEKVNAEKRFKSLETKDAKTEQNTALLQNEITKLQQKRQESESRFKGLERELKDMTELSSEIKPFIEGAKPVASIKEITAASLAILAENNITTVKSLANISAAKLVRMGINPRTAAHLIKQAQEKINLKDRQ
ncbi:MAG: hypothetical protein JKY19_15410, partial [Alcanivoracaceae bacterium]|nr:hypothetical protein [Alcanivoracaceae bacterium]